MCLTPRTPADSLSLLSAGPNVRQRSPSRRRRRHVRRHEEEEEVQYVPPPPPPSPLSPIFAHPTNPLHAAKKVVFESDDVPSEPASAPVAETDDLDFSDLKKKKKKKVVMEDDEEVVVKKVDRMGNELVDEVVVVEKVVEEEGGDEFSDLKKKKKKVRVRAKWGGS